MKPRQQQSSFPSDEQVPREITFSIIDSQTRSEASPGPNSTGTLVDIDGNGLSLLTRTPIQTGNIVKFNHRGASKLGVVMWSVESSDTCRIQVRFI